MLASVDVWRLARHASLHASLAWHGVTSVHAKSSSLRPLASCLRYLQGEQSIDITSQHHVLSLLNTLIPRHDQQPHCTVPSIVQLAARYCSTNIRNARGAASVTSSSASKVDDYDAAPSTSSSTTSSSPPQQHEKPGGWTSRDVLNTANMLSLARLCSGPGIAALIIHQQWDWALPCLAVAGLTDWLDGLAARKLPGSCPSVLGSYLDPLADKVLICCVVGALGVEGSLSWPLVGVVIARDAYLIAGATYHRAAMLQFKWPGWGEFFRIRPGASPTAAPAAPKVVPLLSSKLNTVSQLMLVAAAVGCSWVGAPSQDMVNALGVLTAGTTVWSCVSYTRLYWAGRLFR